MAGGWISLLRAITIQEFETAHAKLRDSETDFNQKSNIEQDSRASEIVGWVIDEFKAEKVRQQVINITAVLKRDSGNDHFADTNVRQYNDDWLLRQAVSDE